MPNPDQQVDLVDLSYQLGAHQEQIPGDLRVKIIRAATELADARLTAASNTKNGRSKAA